MHLIFRFLHLLLTARRRPKLGLFDAATTPGRALLTDIDLAGHINNGMYFSLFDLGRFDLMMRAGAWDVMKRKGWSPVVQAETITFRKSVVLHQRFTQETRIAGMDERCIYFEQRIVVDGEVYVRAVMATRLLSKKGPVPNEEILAAMGVEPPADLALPDWVGDWRSATALPGSRRPAPHVWG
ncbi:acyl-CoA thioesterase [Zafaria sp. Z1313]|uniref:acyl-CoA thioesterase n=1 Tax=unclassified Zafaria TaxID=2828765 RepID=UPI002E793335|nr:acyl-CoA thioesterase [Zafaria sp. J156]MEE1621593.1 acyl-CoA thioesterase [Zafaria sp. J156]